MMPTGLSLEVSKQATLLSPQWGILGSGSIFEPHPQLLTGVFWEAALPLSCMPSSCPTASDYLNEGEKVLLEGIPQGCPPQSL